MSDCSADLWTIGTREGRWAGFGPYYAMFPVSFVREMIQRYSVPGDTIVDPFCGRGTTNYVAQVLGRRSFGCELNPVGWIYARTKTAPARQLGRLLRQIDEIAHAREPSDFVPETEFQEWAWCRDTLGFINCARRVLNWKGSKIDRTLAAFLLVYLHAKIGGGLSNQMRQSKSMAPEYAVRWWKSRSMRPPIISTADYLKSRVSWRYAKGIEKSGNEAQVYFGDARRGLSGRRGDRAALILTSPPYMGVTNYKYDNWIRLWALGGPPEPNSDLEQRYANRERYSWMIRDVFGRLAKSARPDATVVVRTDRRPYTQETTTRAMREVWPDHCLLGRKTRATRPTQTSLFGDRTEKPGEVDLIALAKGSKPLSGIQTLSKGT